MVELLHPAETKIMGDYVEVTLSCREEEEAAEIAVVFPPDFLYSVPVFVSDLLEQSFLYKERTLARREHPD